MTADDPIREQAEKLAEELHLGSMIPEGDGWSWYWVSDSVAVQKLADFALSVHSKTKEAACRAITGLLDNEMLAKVLCEAIRNLKVEDYL